MKIGKQHLLDLGCIDVFFLNFPIISLSGIGYMVRFQQLFITSRICLPLPVMFMVKQDLELLDQWALTRTRSMRPVFALF